MSVTPDFVGQRYKDTNTGNIWIANSTTPGDWTLEVQNMQTKWSPTSHKLGESIQFYIFDDTTLESLNIEASLSTEGIQIVSCSALEHITASLLTNISGSSYAPVYINSCDALLDVLFPLLQNVQDSFEISQCSSITTIDLSSFATASNSFEISNLPDLTSVSLTSLATADSFIFTANNSITSISLPAFTGSNDDFSINVNAALVNISVPQWSPTNGKIYSFTNNALNAASVNGILARAVATPAYVSGQLRLNFGTNSAPTGQGIVDKATLIARGVTVTTN